MTKPPSIPAIFAPIAGVADSGGGFPFAALVASSLLGLAALVITGTTRTRSRRVAPVHGAEDDDDGSEILRGVIHVPR